MNLHVYYSYMSTNGKDMTVYKYVQFMGDI